MTKEEFLNRIKEDEEYSPGWQAIDDAFEKLYPVQKPDHFGTTIPSRAMWGGDEYLDGFSVYTSPKGYKHLVTYGMTVLYGDEEAFGGEWNGWGYEMTIKLKEKDTENCMWAINMMSNLARYTYKTKRFSEIQAIIEDQNNIPKLIELMKADGNEDLVTDMRRNKSYL